METEATYNGWANRATWSTHLWLTGTDEGTYLVARHTALAGDIDTSAQAVEDLCREGWGSRNPDDDLLDLVDWEHIAKALRE